jgi:hypothetical protein
LRELESDADTEECCAGQVAALSRLKQLTKLAWSNPGRQDLEAIAAVIGLRSLELNMHSTCPFLADLELLTALKELTHLECFDGDMFSRGLHALDKNYYQEIFCCRFLSQPTMSTETSSGSSELIGVSQKLAEHLARCKEEYGDEVYHKRHMYYNH